MFPGSSLKMNQAHLNMDIPDDSPLWWKTINSDVNEFSKSSVNGKWQLNRYDFLKELSPGLYESAAQEVKEFNEYHIHNGNSFDQVKLGRKIGSITMQDFFAHPELQKDPKALKKYWELHPELRAHRYNKNGNVAGGPGFDLKK